MTELDNALLEHETARGLMRVAAEQIRAKCAQIARAHTVPHQHEYKNGVTSNCSISTCAERIAKLIEEVEI